MTTRLYVGDPYRSKFTARVIAIDCGSLILDQSCFYGPGGLLPTDSGWIADRQVLGLRRRNAGVLTHVMKPARPSDPTPPQVGDRVRGCIDWSGRYRSMGLHTVQHLIELAASETHDVVATRRPPVRTSEAIVDFTFTSSSVDPTAIADWVCTAVRDDLSMGAIDAPTPPHERLWYLDGYGHCRCDGLHLRTTGELAGVRLETLMLDPGRLRVVAHLAG